MSDTRDRLKAELIQKVQDGQNAKKLQELQGDLLGRIKEELIKELSMARSIKQTTTRKFLWFTITEETRGNLEHIEALQSDLRVILGYESLLEGVQNESGGAKQNLEVLNAGS
jgi:hypothetical protein